MPSADQLPDDLKELHYRNAVELTHARWKSDVQLLIHALRPYLDPPAADAPAPSEAVAPMPGAETAKRSPSSTGPVTVNTASETQIIGAETIARISKRAGAVHRTDRRSNCETGCETVLIGRRSFAEESPRKSKGTQIALNF